MVAKANDPEPLPGARLDDLERAITHATRPPARQAPPFNAPRVVAAANASISPATVCRYGPRSSLRQNSAPMPTAANSPAGCTRFQECRALPSTTANPKRSRGWRNGCGQARVQAAGSPPSIGGKTSSPATSSHTRGVVQTRTLRTSSPRWPRAVPTRALPPSTGSDCA